MRDGVSEESSFPISVRSAFGEEMEMTDAGKLFSLVESGLSEYAEAPAPERPFDAPDPVTILENNS